ncbi:ComF family protein [Virgibacillus sediminis]|uniref:ComF family protein n=1 Tax=Virgibacillus sediminis TaxID=202260 RepID=A0ABV7A2X6_9BACI
MDWNHSLFTYNSAIKEMVAAWKYRGDYQIGSIFKAAMTTSYQRKFSTIHKDHKEMLAVPIPLSQERMNERGFNQAQMLAEYLPLKTASVLTRHHGEKQSKKSRAERVGTKNPFEVKRQLNKPVVLVDDIYTTGTTLRHAAELLKQNDCPAVYSLTLIRS